MNIQRIAYVALLSAMLSACGGASEPNADTATQAQAPMQAGSEEAGHAESGEGHGEEGHEEAEEGAIALEPAQLKAAGIELGEVGPATIRETLPLYGVIAPDAVRLREVPARFPGIIRTVTKNVGDTVARGEVLATVESDESLETYAVAAPLAGVVIARNANPGEQSGDKTLFSVADLSTVWVELSLFPRDARKVRVGQGVRVRSTDGELSGDGRIIYVAPFGQSANQTVTARVELDNAQRQWAPGIYVSADVTLTEAAVAAAVRNEAIQNVEGRDVLYVQEKSGFVARPVKLGRSDGDYSELLSGPAPGARYATRNSFILKAEQGKGDAEHGH